MSDLVQINICLSSPIGPEANLSLFKGLCGDNLLLKDLFLSTRDRQYKDLIYRNAACVLAQVADIDRFDFSNGLCGILYCLLEISDIIGIRLPGLGGIARRILAYAERRQSLGDYDLQSGLIGLGLFSMALSKRGWSEQDVTIRICNIICSLLKEENGVAFLSYQKEAHPFFSRENTWTNNGFLHGINSVLAFFLICIKEGIYNKTMVDWVKRIADNQLWFLDEAKEAFPMAYCLDDSKKLILDNRRTRLHYCTGDFGIINNLCSFSDVFDSSDHQFAAQKAYKKVVRRLLTGESCSKDCFCHGKAGIVYFLERFKTLYYDESLANIVAENKAGLVKSLFTERHDPDILNGDNGIIMALLANRMNSSFERVLLLN